MTQHRYLTKSRFRLAMECPTKLFYCGKTDEYADQSLDDPFLAALADGGFQVGALAKQYYPWGHEIRTLNVDEALEKTAELLKLDSVTIYEAAFRYENLFIRVDILRKQGRCIELIEVKSKSFSSEEEQTPFLGKKGSFLSGWKPYLYDVAFQAYVLGQAMPDHEVLPFLMLADKAARCPADGLNQKFRIRRNSEQRSFVTVSDQLTSQDLSVPMLKAVPVGDCVDKIRKGEGTDDFGARGFEGTVQWLADHYLRDEKITPVPGAFCRDCSFRATDPDVAAGLKSGFKECWTEAYGWQERDFEAETLFALWDFRDKDSAMANGKLKLVDLEEGDIAYKDDGKPGLSRTARQLVQLQKAKNGDMTPYIDRDGLQREMDSWRFPLHFIDFETSVTPIPFTKDRSPYETVAFQFSHHMVGQDGTVRHAGEYLCGERGRFPNFEFVGQLKQALEKDHGTIFRYSHHENTVLVSIYHQLAESDLDADERQELMDFIVSVTESTGRNGTAWSGGPRNMVDLCHLVKRYYYDPYTRGSNSIKYVLPAVLNSSAYLQNKYGSPVYGTAEMPSFNFRNWQWIKHADDGTVKDPYSLLPLLFSDIDDRNQLLLLSGDEEQAIKNGGAAMTAYARLQYEEMGEYERSGIMTGLKKYCELDTLAMVMIYEAWREWL